MLANRDCDYVQRFTGSGLAYDLVCTLCAREPGAIDGLLADVCSDCFGAIEKEGCWEGILGSPEVRIGSRTLHFQHETMDLPALQGQAVLDLQPVEGTTGLWVAFTSAGSLIELDAAGRSARTVARVPLEALERDGPSLDAPRAAWLVGPRCELRVSRGGGVAAVANTYGRRGVVVDISTGDVTMSLCRDPYHEEVSTFPLALADVDERTLVIHGTAWNRLDVSDARTGVLLTQRVPTSYKAGEERPPHYLDYFHSGLAVSPGGQFVADNGWVWAPVGVVTTWSLRRWLNENVWESEDGESKRGLCWRGYYWDGPLCWLDDHRLAVWGYGRDDEWLIPAVTVFDVRSGERERWFPGPKGSLAFDGHDGHLFSFDPAEGLTAWDVRTGERVAKEPGFCPVGYHRGGRHFLSIVGDGAVRVSRVVAEGERG